MTNYDKIRKVSEINNILTCFVQNHSSDFSRSDFKNLLNLLYDQKKMCNSLMEVIE